MTEAGFYRLEIFPTNSTKELKGNQSTDAKLGKSFSATDPFSIC